MASFSCRQLELGRRTHFLALLAPTSTPSGKLGHDIGHSLTLTSYCQVVVSKGVCWWLATGAKKLFSPAAYWNYQLSLLFGTFCNDLGT